MRSGLAADVGGYSLMTERKANDSPEGPALAGTEAAARVFNGVGVDSVDTLEAALRRSLERGRQQLLARLTLRPNASSETRPEVEHTVKSARAGQEPGSSDPAAQAVPGETERFV